MKAPPRCASERITPTLRRRFELIVFDWDGTAVPDRKTHVPELNALLAQLLSTGLPLAPVTGTNVSNLERQSLLFVAAAVRRNLFACTNRGSEIFSYDPSGERITLYRYIASDDENCRLTEAADEAQRRLQARNLATRIVYDRLNRRKIDLIPDPAWDDPPKARIRELIAATNERVHAAGFTAIGDVIRLVTEVAEGHGLHDPRVTSDGKYVEVGLTDKSDSIRWLMEHVAHPRGIAGSDVLIVGDEFGSLGGFEGSDARMIDDCAAGATYVSVGTEPAGPPPGVVHAPGGSASFLEILSWQRRLRNPTS